MGAGFEVHGLGQHRPRDESGNRAVVKLWHENSGLLDDVPREPTSLP